jgi:hypothetical protein
MLKRDAFSPVVPRSIPNRYFIPKGVHIPLTPFKGGISYSNSPLEGGKGGVNGRGYDHALPFFIFDP